MDFSLTEDQKAFVESARAFSDGALAPNAAHWDEDAVFAKDALRQAGRDDEADALAASPPAAD